MQDDLVKVTGALMQGLMDISKDYREKIENAKTPFKKEYYKKKLKKNNLKLMQVLTTMERIGRDQNKLNQEDKKDDAILQKQHVEYGVEDETKS